MTIERIDQYTFLDEVLKERMRNIVSVHPTGRPYFRTKDSRTFTKKIEIERFFDWVFNPSLVYYVSDNPHLNVRFVNPHGRIIETRITCLQAKELYDVDLKDIDFSNCHTPREYTKLWKLSPATATMIEVYAERDAITFASAFASALEISLQTVQERTPFLQGINQPQFMDYPSLYVAATFPVKKTTARKYQSLIRVVK